MTINQTAKGKGQIIQLAIGGDLVIGSNSLIEPEDSIILENPVLNPVFLDREQEIPKYVNDLDNKHHAVITGFAGIGKTQLGYAVSIERSKLGKIIFLYSFEKPGSDNIDTIFLHLAIFLKKNHEDRLWDFLVEESRSKTRFSERSKHNLLAACLENGKYLLCFDDCQFVEQDNKIVGLLVELIQLHKTEVIIISRQRPWFLDYFSDPLEGLDIDNTQLLFNKLGVSISTNLLKKFWEKVEGNPKLIELFITWLREKQRTIPEIREFIEKMQKREIRGYLLRICKVLSEEEFKIMYGMSIFRGEVIDIETLSYVTECHDQRLVIRLLDRFFIDEGPSRGTLRIHQLLSDFFFDIANKEDIRKIHSKAATYFLSYRNYFSSAYHFFESKEYDKAAEILFENIKPDAVIMNLDPLGKLIQKFSRENLVSENWIKICYLNAWIGSVTGDWQQVENLVNNEILPRAKQTGYKYGEALGLNILGTIYSRRGLKEKAKGYYLQCLDILSEYNQDDLIPKTLNNLGIIARIEKDYILALDYYDRSITASINSGNLLNVSETLHNKGIVYSAQKEYDEAIKYYRRSLYESRSAGNYRALAYTYNNLGVICKLKGRYRAAEKMFQLSLSIKEKIHDTHGRAQTSSNLALIYGSYGRLDSAEEYSNKAVELFSLIDDYDGIGKTWDNLASLFTNETEKRTIYMDKAIDVANRFLNGKITWELYRGEFYDALH